MRKIFNEESTFTVRARFFGSANTLQTPQTIRYRIDDLTNDRVVRDWTDLQPDSSVDIQVIAGDNAVYNDSAKKAKRFRIEDRVLTIQANYETDDQYAEEYRYQVKNLRGFDS